MLSKFEEWRGGRCGWKRTREERWSEMTESELGPKGLVVMVKTLHLLFSVKGATGGFEVEERVTCSYLHLHFKMLTCLPRGARSESRGPGRRSWGGSVGGR